MWRTLKHHGISPVPQRTNVTWTQFLRSQAAVAYDFATVDTAWLRRYYLLFFIDIANREVFYGGITANPSGAWTTQAARNLFLRHPQPLTHSRALVRDRGSQFIDAFDQIFRTEGLKILRTPVRAPVANAFAERWIGTLRRELLDRTIIWNQRQLEHLVTDYIDHYNAHRPHRSLNQRPPAPTQPPRLELSERHAAEASSTNTEEPPDQPRQGFGHPHGAGEWREGTSPSRSLRTVRDSLPSYGSHSPAWG